MTQGQQFSKQRGFGVLRGFALVIGSAIGLLILVVGFYEGRKAYWDYQVSAMCEKDGGVMVHEQTRISIAHVRELPKIEGSVSIPAKALARPTDVLVSIDSEKVLKDWDPRVIRREKLIVRQADHKVVGSIVSYSRGGGDLPTGIAHGSSYTCPDYRKLYLEQGRFFLVEDAK